MISIEKFVKEFYKALGIKSPRRFLRRAAIIIAAGLLLNLVEECIAYMMLLATVVFFVSMKIKSLE